MQSPNSRMLARLVVWGALMGCGGGAADNSAPVGTDPTAPTPRVAASIVVSQSNVSFASLGASQTLTAEVRDQRGEVMPGATVVWTSSNPGVVSVAGLGVVTAVAAGTATVVATSGPATVPVPVSVVQTVSTIAVSPNAVTLTNIGALQPLVATARDAGGHTVPIVGVTWSISPASVATISSTGLVTAVSAGQAIATAAFQSVVGTVPVQVQGISAPPPCSARPVFAEYLIDPSLLKVVTQIGVVGGGGTSLVGRSYAFAVDGDDVRLPLTAPTALRIVAARHYRPPGAPTQGYVPDWALVLDVGCDITLELYHVKDVAPSIKALIDTTIYNSSGWQPLPQPIPLRAGELFAWYMRGLNSVAFDVVAHDRTRRNQFANQARYDVGSNLLDIVCPWTLFAPAKRDAYLAIIGAPTGQRVTGAGCGTVERDVAGTPAGQWFLSPNVTDSWLLAKSGHYGNPLPIALGVDSTVYVGHIGPSNDVRIDRSNGTWKDPSRITTSWCYQARNGSSDAGWLWLRMNSATQMDVAYDPDGSCPVTFPATGFAAYFR